MRHAAPLSLALCALVAAGCGGGGGSGAAGTKASGTVSVRDTSLGDILVDASGRTVYLFEKDRGGRSACSGACAQAWPPVTVTGAPRAGSGASAKLLGTVRRADGTREVTYAGHPLYRFSGDRKAGDTKGQGQDAFGAEWYVIDAKGAKVEDEGGGGGNPYGY